MKVGRLLSATNLPRLEAGRQEADGDCSTLAPARSPHVTQEADWKRGESSMISMVR